MGMLRPFQILGFEVMFIDFRTIAKQKSVQFLVIVGLLVVGGLIVGAAEVDFRVIALQARKRKSDLLRLALLNPNKYGTSARAN
jgi:hypothetical protein